MEHNVNAVIRVQQNNGCTGCISWVAMIFIVAMILGFAARCLGMS